MEETFTEVDIKVPRDIGIFAGGNVPMSPSDQSCASTQAEESDCKVIVCHTETRVSSVEASSICQNIMIEILQEAECRPLSEKSLAVELGKPPDRLSDFEQDTGRYSSHVQTACSKTSFLQDEVPMSSLFGSVSFSSPHQTAGGQDGMLFDVVPAGRHAFQQPAIPRLDFSGVQGRFAGPVAKDSPNVAMFSPSEESCSSDFFRPADQCACQVSLQCGQFWRFA